MAIYVLSLIIAAMWFIIGDLMFDLIMEEDQNPNRERHELDDDEEFKALFTPWTRCVTMLAGPLMYVYSVFFDRDK